MEILERVKQTYANNKSRYFYMYICTDVWNRDDHFVCHSLIWHIANTNRNEQHGIFSILQQTRDYITVILRREGFFLIKLRTFSVTTFASKLRYLSRCVLEYVTFSKKNYDSNLATFLTIFKPPTDFGDDLLNFQRWKSKSSAGLFDNFQPVFRKPLRASPFSINFWRTTVNSNSIPLPHNSQVTIQFPFAWFCVSTQSFPFRNRPRK